MLSLEIFLPTTHIGSLPFTEVEKALETSLSFDIPAWPQLPKFKNEGMIWQFIKSFPGFHFEKERIVLDSETFEEELVNFYETYVEIIENNRLDLLKGFWEDSSSRAFIPFIERLRTKKTPITKGQITGPFTLGTTLKTIEEECIIFREDLRDLLIKFITLKALAQSMLLKEVSSKVILFIDEPGLAGFGSSSYITLSKELVQNMLNEIFEVLHSFDIVTGVHICANTSWDLVLETQVKIVNFDSFSYFDRFVIYSDSLSKFLRRDDTFIAWGVVPTDIILLEATNREEILERFTKQLTTTAQKLDMDLQDLLKRSLITPACGMGSLPEEAVGKVINLLNSIKLAFK
ncbi:MAG: hypothetical protein ABDI07_07040 [Candidatus Kryptonium sp.]